MCCIDPLRPPRNPVIALVSTNVRCSKKQPLVDVDPSFKFAKVGLRGKQTFARKGSNVRDAGRGRNRSRGIGAVLLVFRTESTRGDFVN